MHRKIQKLGPARRKKLKRASKRRKVDEDPPWGPTHIGHKPQVRRQPRWDPMELQILE